MTPRSHASEQFSQYEVLEELGAGGMGRVYKARCRRDGQMVALKLIRHERATSGDDTANMVRLLQKEARIQAHLQHPCIARFLGFEQDGGRELLVMEFVEG